MYIYVTLCIKFEFSWHYEIDSSDGRLYKVFAILLGDKYQQEGNGPIDLRVIVQWNIVYEALWLRLLWYPCLYFLKQPFGRHLMTSKQPRPQRPQLGFEISNLNYHGIYVLIASNSHFSGVWGHGGLQMASTASEVKCDLKFEISNLNYPCIHMHVASNSQFICLWGCGSLQMTSEVTYDLRFELSDLNYLCCHASLASKYHYFKNVQESKGDPKAVR